MKKVFIFFMLAVLMGVSCDQNTNASYTEEFYEGKVKVKVSGKRMNVLTPFVATINVDAYGNKGESGEFEWYVDDINSGNVKFDWQTEKDCNIRLIERDGAEKNFKLKASKGELSLYQLNK